MGLVSAADRLAEIDARANAATEGQWSVELSWTNAGDNDGYPSYAVVSRPDRDAVASDAIEEDAEFIAHAREDVPALVAALRAVLDLHAPVPVYGWADDCDGDDEHHEQQHFETDAGDYLCKDKPTGEVMCASCNDEVDGDAVPYPCTTARAIDAALGVTS